MQWYGKKWLHLSWQASLPLCSTWACYCINIMHLFVEKVVKCDKISLEKCLWFMSEHKLSNNMSWSRRPCWKHKFRPHNWHDIMSPQSLSFKCATDLRLHYLFTLSLLKFDKKKIFEEGFLCNIWKGSGLVRYFLLCYLLAIVLFGLLEATFRRRCVVLSDLQYAIICRQPMCTMVPLSVSLYSISIHPSLLVKDWASWHRHLWPMNLFLCGMFRTGVSGAFSPKCSNIFLVSILNKDVHSGSLR